MFVKSCCCLIALSLLGFSLTLSSCIEHSGPNPQPAYYNPYAQLYNGPLYLPHVLLRGSEHENEQRQKSTAFPADSYPLPEYAVPQATVPHGWQQITPPDGSPWIHEPPGFQWVPELPVPPAVAAPPTTQLPSTRYSCHYLMVNRSLVPVCHTEP